MKKIILTVLLGVFCLSFSFSSREAYASASLKGGGARQHSMAPDFTLGTVSGKTIALKDFKGKGIILFFFTTWCPYCREKMPELARDYKTYQSQGIELLAIDAGESKSKVSSFAVKEDLPFDILLDAKTDVADSFGVLGIPTFVLISKEGKVVYFGNDLPSHYATLVEK